jgi:hypothetical protein
MFAPQAGRDVHVAELQVKIAELEVEIRVWKRENFIKPISKPF